MKKIFVSVICMLLCIFCLASCADGVMKTYDDDKIGLHYRLPGSFELDKYSNVGIYKTYHNKAKTAYVFIYYFPMDQLLENPKYDKTLTLEKYLNIFIEDQELTDAEIEIEYNDDKSGATFDLFTGNGEEDPESQYIYHTFIKNEKGIYLVQMMCAEMVSDDYAPQFIDWSDSIYTY